MTHSLDPSNGPIDVTPFGETNRKHRPRDNLQGIPPGEPGLGTYRGPLWDPLQGIPPSDPVHVTTYMKRGKGTLLSQRIQITHSTGHPPVDFLQATPSRGPLQRIPLVNHST